MNQPWLSPNKLETFAASIHQKGSAVRNCWGLMVPYSPFAVLEVIRELYIMAINVFMSYEGKEHDSSMLQDSRLLTELSQYSHDSTGNILCICGDPAYPLLDLN